MLGSLRKTQGRMDEADSLYRSAIKVITKVDEDDTSIDIALDRLRSVDRTLRIARRALAELLLKQHKVAEAAEQYREVIRIDHKDAKAHTVIALDHSQQGRDTEAVQAIEQALDDKPGYKPALRLLERIQNSH